MGASIKAGGEYVGMEPFVKSGPRSGIPHTTWRRRKIEPGDVTVLETSACYNRYHVASFRTVACGKIPQLALDMYKVCAEGLEAAMIACCELKRRDLCAVDIGRAENRGRQLRG